MQSHFCFSFLNWGMGMLTLGVNIVRSASVVTLQISSVIVIRKVQWMPCKHSPLSVICDYCTFPGLGIPLRVFLAPIQSVISCIRTELPGSLRSRDFKMISFRTSLRFCQPCSAFIRALSHTVLPLNKSLRTTEELERLSSLRIVFLCSARLVQMKPVLGEVIVRMVVEAVIRWWIDSAENSLGCFWNHCFTAALTSSTRISRRVSFEQPSPIC